MIWVILMGVNRSREMSSSNVQDDESASGNSDNESDLATILQYLIRRYSFCFYSWCLVWFLKDNASSLHKLIKVSVKELQVWY